MRDAAVVLLATLCACTAELPLTDDDVVHCSADDACPAGFMCVAGARCVSSDGIDERGALPILPSANAVVRDSVPVSFAWQPVRYAARYTVTVATDAAMTRPVATAVTEQPGQTTVDIELEPGTYYWRALADVTDPSLPDPPTIFGVVGAVVTVHCAPSEDCNAREPIELGTPERPYRSVSRAVTAAAALGATEVRVTAREDGTPYNDTVSLLPGIDLVGIGPERAVLASMTSALVASEIRAPTRVAHMHFINDGTGEFSTVVRITACNDQLVLDDLEIEARNVTTDILRAEDTRIADGPHLTRSFVYGEVDPARASALGVNLASNAAMQLDEVDVRFSGAPGSATNLAALSGTSSRVVIDDCTVRVAGGASSIGVSIGGVADRAAELVVRHSRIESRATGHAFAMQASNTDVVLERSTFFAGAGQQTSPIAINATNVLTSGTSRVSPARIVSNLVIAGVCDVPNGSGTAITLQGIDALIAGNTLIVGGGDLGQNGVTLYGAYARFVNDVMIATGSIACLTPNCRVAIGEGNNPPHPRGDTLAVVDVAVSGFSCPYFDSGCQQTPFPGQGIFEPKVTDFSTMETVASLGLSGFAGADGLPATADDDGVPALGSLIDAGHSFGATDCTTTSSGDDLGNFVVSRVESPSCGAVTLDHDGNPRDATPTIGAFEPR